MIPDGRSAWQEGSLLLSSLPSPDRDALGSEIASASSPVSRVVCENLRVLSEEMLTLPPDSVIAPIRHGHIRRVTLSVTLQSGKSMPKMDGACTSRIPFLAVCRDESLPSRPLGVLK